MPQGQGLKGDTSSSPLLDLVNAINPFAYPIQQGIQIAQQGIGPFVHNWWQELMGNKPPEGGYYMGVAAPKPEFDWIPEEKLVEGNANTLTKMSQMMYGGKTMADWYKQYGYDPQYHQSWIESHPNDPSIEMHWVPTMHQDLASKLTLPQEQETPTGLYVTYNKGLIDQLHKGYGSASQRMEELYQTKHGYLSPSVSSLSPTQVPIPKNAKQLFLPLWEKKSYTAQPSEARDIHTIINSKDSAYHATSLEGFKGILNSGVINPGYGQGDIIPGYSYGVSTSRVPRVASKNTKAISLVLDKDALRQYQSTPIAESGYKKTLNNWDYPGYRGERDAPMSKHFEFEDRTKGEGIPLRYVKGIVVDKKALFDNFDDDIWNIPNKQPGVFGGKTYYQTYDIDNPSGSYKNFPTKEAAQNYINAAKIKSLNDIKQLATQKGLPVKFLENGGEVNTYRAKMSKIPSGQPLYNPFGAIGAGLGAYQLYKSMTGQGDQNAQ